MTVLGQHPMGLDLHIRNLRWALNEINHRIYIFTSVNHNIDHTLFPDVIFIESECKPNRWHNYWSKEIPTYIRSDCKENLFLFSQLDTIYTDKLQQTVKTVHENQSIAISKLDHHCPLKIGNQSIYPRIWEGGTLIPRSVLFDAIQTHELRLDKRIYSEWIISKLKDCTDEVLFGKILRSVRHGDELDTFGELSIYCYLMQVPFMRCLPILHFVALETIHRKYPDCYGPLLTINCLQQFLADGYSAKPVFMYYLTGCYRWNNVIDKFISSLPKHDFWELNVLKKSAAEWMSKKQLFRLKRLLGQKTPTFL